MGTADVTAEPPAGGTDSQQAGGGGEADRTAETEVELQAKVQRYESMTCCISRSGIIGDREYLSIKNILYWFYSFYHN